MPMIVWLPLVVFLSVLLGVVLGAILAAAGADADRQW